MKNNKKGINMIVLLITVIVILIIATIAISNIVDDNYFEKAKYANFLENFNVYKEQLEDYIGNQEVINNGRYNRESLYATRTQVTYNGSVIPYKTIKDIIPIISDDYLSQIEVYKGNLKYVGDNEEIKNTVNIYYE